ncbi:MAG: hypothetical protein ABIE36_02660 [Candidatus Diapherotrites archaeon]
MKINKIFLISSLILLACLPQMCAIIDIKINMEPEFFTGEVISFNYTINSDTGQTIKYVEKVDCPSAPHAILDVKMAILSSGLPLLGEYKSLKVTDNIAPQECTAYLAVLEPVEKIISKNFTINTNPSFNFNLVLDKKVFVRNQDIDIDYQSEVSNPIIEASLTFPDKSTENISLPYLFKAKQIGTYELNIVALKEGYKTVSLVEEFGVIKEDAKIGYVDFKGGFAVQEKTNLFNKPGERDTIGKVVRYVIYFLVGIIIFIIVLELINRFRDRKN